MIHEEDLGVLHPMLQHRFCSLFHFIQLFSSRNKTEHGAQAQKAHKSGE